MEDKRNTIDVNEQVSKCESLVELQEILSKNSNYYKDWKQYINRLVERKHMNYVQLSKACHCSRNTVKKWCREGAMPQNRETFLMIGLGLRLNLEEFNELLLRYGRYPRLYGKNMEDAVCLFVIRHYPSEGDAYEVYLQLKEHLLKRMREYGKGDARPLDTMEIEERLMAQESTEEFEQFICENAGSYEESYHKLAEFIQLFIKAKEENVHRFVQTNSLSFSYEKMMSALRQRGECPNRIKLILLGVNLNMSMEQINYMLSLAYMKPMCAKDNLECIIMYAVENAYLMNPAYSVESAIILQHYKQNPVLQKKCRDILAQYWEAGLYAEERETLRYLEESIGDYLKNILQELDWEEQEIFRYL